MIELVLLKEFIKQVHRSTPNVGNRCHDLLMVSMNLSDIVILNIKSSDYRCVISLISKNEAINSMENAGLTKKVENYKT